jgi:hypothetical protein
MRRAHAFLLVIALLAGASSCRIFSREVACSRNGDCPRDAGMDFCDLPEDSDGGAGVCVAEDPDPPDGNDDDDDGGFPLFPDGGFPDAGA